VRARRSVAAPPPFKSTHQSNVNMHSPCKENHNHNEDPDDEEEDKAAAVLVVFCRRGERGSEGRGGMEIEVKEGQAAAQDAAKLSVHMNLDHNLQPTLPLQSEIRSRSFQ
jgi:hypothetical protein